MVRAVSVDVSESLWCRTKSFSRGKTKLWGRCWMCWWVTAPSGITHSKVSTHTHYYNNCLYWHVKKPVLLSWSVTLFFSWIWTLKHWATLCWFAGSVQTSEEVQEAERRRRAAGRGVQSSLHSAGVRQVRLILFKTAMLIIDFHLSYM